MATKSWLFIDADNQPPALGPSAIRFLESIGRPAERAVVAGNGAGRRVTDWEISLRDTCPTVEILTHIAPMRKQSADAILLLEMAPFYHNPTDDRPLIMILSRDDLLVAAAELLASRDHDVLISLSATNPSPVTTVPVLILPVDGQPAPPKSAAAIEVNSANPELVDSTVLQNAARAIRHHLGAQNKKTGYLATAVGQVLANLGHDKAMRTRILTAIAEIRTDDAGVRRVRLTGR
ncbi:MAG: hypothetical protein ABR558_10575 [Thioalkalivibrio sp.]